MKLKEMPFTKETLVKIGDCQEAIDFCERNELFTSTAIKDLKIKGYYKGWPEWLKIRLNWGYEYDDQGRLARKTWPDGGFVEYEYDDQGHLVRETWSDGDVIKYEYEYDEQGWLLRETWSDGIIITYEYEYDEQGRLARKTRSNGDVIKYEYIKKPGYFEMRQNGLLSLSIRGL